MNPSPTLTQFLIGLAPEIRHIYYREHSGTAIGGHLMARLLITVTERGNERNVMLIGSPDVIASDVVALHDFVIDTGRSLTLVTTVNGKVGNLNIERRIVHGC